jgi:error-prone DNA polymerase
MRPAQIVRDAQRAWRRGAQSDINHSQWDNTLERETANWRCGWAFGRSMAFIKSGPQALAVARVSLRQRRRPLAARTPAKPGAQTARRCRCVPLHRHDRRKALWAVRRLPDDVPLPLFEAANRNELAEPDTKLPTMALAEHVVADYQTIRLSLKAHPMALLRPQFFDAEKVLTCQDMWKPDGAWGNG